MITIKKLFDLLAPSEHKNIVFVLCMILFMALIDAIGIASILPFITVLANPESVETNQFLAYLFKNLNFKSTNDFFFFLGSLVFTILLFSLVFKATSNYVQYRFVQNCEYSLSKRFFEAYMHQPYAWFIERNSADLGKNILSEIEGIVGNGILPLIIIIAQSAVALAIIILLIYIDPILALAISFSLGICYVVIFNLMGDFLTRISLEQVKANQQRYIIVNEAFSVIKELKVRGIEQFYTNRFKETSKAYAKNKASAQLSSQLPRFLLEALAFGGILLIVLYFIARYHDFTIVIPRIALYAFAGYRLLPALQQIYSNSSILRFTKPSIDLLHSELKNIEIFQKNINIKRLIKLKVSIKLNNISFNYNNSSNLALKNLNINIKAKTTVGLVGSSGSGKTTIVDCILGLLEPKEGFLSVDDMTINQKNSSQWQKTIGYVPQQIFITDDTVAANIAFGVDSNNIDYKSVERAARAANVHDFVIKQLPQGYSTILGERGIRLSGGQRQRIAIARALYHKPQILIFDEATSALDGATEEAVIKAVNKIAHSITIIMIAHRLSTVRNCDEIFLIEKGKLLAHGTYNELNGNNKIFQKMTGKIL